ncbi:HAD hydrolase family protein [Streptomyces sp. NBC_01236]|uniref:HAD hydrolase family protein n=1 Tax=Streptomyces sp. NBC_01236 TaxID=2903789 RepID=UPI002E0DF139|nr:HAD hydrolase family protein [Streptomyces sp. NBC_01236]
MSIINDRPAAATSDQTGPSVATAEQIRRAPKVLLHDHLDGGVRPATVLALAREKILAAHPELPVDELSEALAPVVGDRAVITRSTGAFLELSAPGVDKGEALRRLARQRGLPPENTAAVGDMPNDIPMLRAAGLAAAVANAHEDTLRAADIVLPSNDDEGVAALIRLVLPRTLTGEACCI